MKKHIIYILVAFCLSSFVSSYASQLPGATWLEIGPGGRAAGLAEAMTAAVEGPTSTYWNPAITGISGDGAEAMHSEWVEGMVSQYIAAEFQSGSWGIGYSALHFGSGNIEFRDGPTSEPLGGYESRAYAVGVSLARTLPFAGIRVGMSGRYLSDAIYAWSADGWSMDLGLFRPGLLNGLIDVGATIRHLGDMQPLRDEAYDLPTTVSGGLRYHTDTFGVFRPDIILDVSKVRGHDLSVRGAVETYATSLIALRAGYTTGYEARGISAGFGLHWKLWRFDYGLTPFSDDLGNTHRFSIGKNW
jgi:hypothetical protein